MASLKIRAVYTSPLERAIETAEPIARVQGLAPQVVEGLGEMNVGNWEGRTIAELEDREDWRRFNTFRSGMRPPGGELMIETQTRMIQQLECFTTRHPGGIVAVVSHGDPLRSVIAFYLGVSLESMLHFEVGPASLSVIQAGDWGARVLCVNQTEEIPV